MSDSILMGASALGRKGLPSLAPNRWLAVAAIAIWAIAWQVPLPTPQPQDVAHLAPRRYLEVVGEVVGVPQPGPLGWRATLANLEAAGEARLGQVVARFPQAATGMEPGSRPAPGTRWRLRGRLTRPEGALNPGAFDAAAFYARQGVFATVGSETAVSLGPAPGWMAAARRALDACRLRLLAAIAPGLSPKHAALFGSLLVGAGAAPVDPAMAKSFRDAGLAHLLAASGAQVAMLTGLTLALLRRLHLSAPLTGTFTAAVVLGYLALTGASPGMVRASGMGLVAVLALMMGRTPRPFAALWLVVIALLLYDPGSAHDLGFQFSVLATYGLCRLARTQPPFRCPAWLWTAVLTPVVAWLWVSPWQAAVFNQVPLLALPANWLASPLIALLTPWGFGLAALGLLSSSLAHGLNTLTTLGVAALIAIADSVAAQNWQLLTVPALPASFTLSLYLALAGGGRRLSGVLGTRLTLPLALPALMLALGIAGYTHLASRGLEVTVLAVGQGDALAIRSPGGRWALVDAGPKTSAGDAGTAVMIPFLRREGCRRIDVLAGSHPHADHVGGMAALLGALPVGEVWDAGIPGEDDTTDDLLAGCLAAGVPWRSPRIPPIGQVASSEGGQQLPTTLLWEADGVRLSSLPVATDPASVNDASLVLLLEYGRSRMLLPGDLEVEGEEELLARIGRHQAASLHADILKVGHHGSGGASGTAWLAAISPQLAIVSCGRGNRHGHPHAAALARLAEANVAIARTDQDGAVRLRSDGSTWQVTDRHSNWRKWQAIPKREQTL